MKPISLLLLLSIFTWSCQSSSSENDNALLEEAGKIHLEAIQIEKTIKPKLDELVQAKNRLSIQGRALNADEQAFINKVEQLQSSYNYWEENHVEVPGTEHDHGHDHSHEGHDHSHDHGPKLEVSAADMLLIQKEFRDSILSIKQRIEEIE